MKIYDAIGKDTRKKVLASVTGKTGQRRIGCTHGYKCMEQKGRYMRDKIGEC